MADMRYSNDLAGAESVEISSIYMRNEEFTARFPGARLARRRTSLADMPIEHAMRTR